MNPSFEIERPDHFTAGAVGPKGQRVFYLQVRQDGVVATFKVEKQQVQVLADYLERMLENLPPSNETTGAREGSDAPPVSPTTAATTHAKSSNIPTGGSSIFVL